MVEYTIHFVIHVSVIKSIYLLLIPFASALSTHRIISLYLTRKNNYLWFGGIFLYEQLRDFWSH